MKRRKPSSHQPEMDARSSLRSRKLKPARLKPAVLDRGMSAEDGLAAIMRANLRHLKANERGLLHGHDPEHLHQARVALRRMRSALGVFAPVLSRKAIEPLRLELRWLLRSLGPARDWDVFVRETLPSIRSARKSRSELQDLAERATRLRGVAHLRALRSVRSPRYRRLVSRLDAWPAPRKAAPGPGTMAGLMPLPGFAVAMLERRHAKVIRRGRELPRLSSRGLHRLRVAIKKYRYTASFFSGLFDPRSSHRTLKRLSRLQDILGRLNDAAVSHELAVQACADSPKRGTKAARRLLREWRRARKAALKHDLARAWKAFSAEEKFW